MQRELLVLPLFGGVEEAYDRTTHWNSNWLANWRLEALPSARLRLKNVAHWAPSGRRAVLRVLVVEGFTAATRVLPLSSDVAETTRIGGLISYAPPFAEHYVLAAAYVDKILKGAKPAELPVEEPTRYELILNLKTAKSLGLSLPRSVLVSATELIGP